MKYITSSEFLQKIRYTLKKKEHMKETQSNFIADYIKSLASNIKLLKDQLKY